MKKLEIQLVDSLSLPFGRLLLGIIFTTLLASCATDSPPIALDKVQPMTPTEARSFLANFSKAEPESLDYGAYPGNRVIKVSTSFSMIDIFLPDYQKYPTSETRIPLLDLTNLQCVGSDSENGMIEKFGSLNCKYGSGKYFNITFLQTTPGTPQRLLSAINALAMETQRFFSAKEEEQFQHVLQEYKSNLIQPNVPKEELEKLMVQAQDAVQDKNFMDAADLYLQAGELAPLMPSAHFNAALILADTGDYSFAIREMKRYLVLSPQASNAHVAQDQIFRWERKTQ